MAEKIIKFKDLQVEKDRVKDIITDYEKLSDRCDEIDAKKCGKEIQKTISELKNTIRAHEDVVALSANQIGHTERVIVLNFNGDLKTFVNPIITSQSGIQLAKETCHSIPGKKFISVRNTKVSIMYQTPMGKVKSTELIGLAAIIMQHHIDHLDGLLLSDTALEIDDEFESASEEVQNQIIQMYLDSLDIGSKELEKEIDSDKDAKRLKDAVRFIQSVNSGETKIEEIPWTEEQINLVEQFREEQKKEKNNGNS